VLAQPTQVGHSEPHNLDTILRNYVPLAQASAYSRFQAVVFRVHELEQVGDVFIFVGLDAYDEVPAVGVDSSPLGGSLTSLDVG
jgi:hypothetical protein